MLSKGGVHCFLHDADNEVDTVDARDPNHQRVNLSLVYFLHIFNIAFYIEL
jgi:hypothetical protein